MKILQHLDRVKKTGSDKWVALCPIHQEKTPSLNIKLAEDGSILAHCFGCGANGLDLYRHFNLDINELMGGKEKPVHSLCQKDIESLRFEKLIVAIAESDGIDNLKYKDRKRYESAIYKIQGIKNKFPWLV